MLLDQAYLPFLQLVPCVFNYVLLGLYALILLCVVVLLLGISFFGYSVNMFNSHCWLLSKLLLWFSNHTVHIPQFLLSVLVHYVVFLTAHVYSDCWFTFFTLLKSISQFRFCSCLTYCALFIVFLLFSHCAYCIISVLFGLRVGSCKRLKNKKLKTLKKVELWFSEFLLLWVYILSFTCQVWIGRFSIVNYRVRVRIRIRIRVRVRVRVRVRGVF